MLIKLIVVFVMANDWVLAQDLLVGNGNFTLSNLNNWNNQLVNSTVTSYTSRTESMVKIVKSVTDIVDMNQALIYSFGLSQPKHLKFSFSSSYFDREDCNVRLYSSTYKSSMFSFRLGNNGLIRVNSNQIQEFYNNTNPNMTGQPGLTDATVTDPTLVNWVDGNFLFDYENKKVRSFLNGKFVSEDDFYYGETVGDVNAIMLYNLKGNTTSYIKDLKVCLEICDSFNKANIVYYFVFVLAIVICLYI